MKRASQANQHQRGSSPSKIPVKAGDSPPPPARPETHSQPQQKVVKPHQRPSLPAICETRTPSSCSDISTSSYMSAASGDSFTISMTTSNMSSDTPTDNTVRSTSKESTTTGGSTDDISKTSPAKKEKGMGFMQRLLSKKKKEPEKTPPPIVTSSNGAAAANKYRLKQSQPEPPKEQPLPKKSRPFVYVRQRIMSIQHDNEEELIEKRKKREREKELEKERNRERKAKLAKVPPSPKCKHGAKSRDSDSSDLSDRH